MYHLRRKGRASIGIRVLVCMYRRKMLEWCHILMVCRHNFEYDDVQNFKELIQFIFSMDYFFIFGSCSSSSSLSLSMKRYFDTCFSYTFFNSLKIFFQKNVFLHGSHSSICRINSTLYSWLLQFTWDDVHCSLFE